MKNILLLISFLFSYTAFAQVDFNFLEKESIGKCFYTYPTDTVIGETTYLEIVPPIYQTFSIRTDDERIFELFDIDMSGSESVKIEVVPSAEKLVTRKADRNCLSHLSRYEYDNRLILCKIETLPEFKELDKVVKIINGDTLIILRLQKVKYQRLVENGHFKIITAEEAKVSENEIIKINNHNWTEWKELLCPTCCFCNKIYPLQKCLRAVGYELDLNGVLDSKTRAALTDFQKKNNLPTGRLDLETLRLLNYPF